MNQKMDANKSVLAVSVALVLVVALVLGFVLFRPEHEQEGIVLPTAGGEPAADMAPMEPEEASFLTITTENVRSALASLSRPTHYNQCYEVVVGVDEVRAARTVELWVNGDLIHAEIRSDSAIKHVLTNGETAWIWYDTDPIPVSITLNASVQTEDLLGLPGFDYLQALLDIPVVEADYLLLQEPQTQCIYVCAQTAASETDRWWINLENGLLYRADALEHSQMVYEVRQTYYAQLAEGDETYTGKFLLPDGSDPFTETEETPLP